MAVSFRPKDAAVQSGGGFGATPTAVIITGAKFDVWSTPKITCVEFVLDMTDPEGNVISSRKWNAADGAKFKVINNGDSIDLADAYTEESAENQPKLPTNGPNSKDKFYTFMELIESLINSGVDEKQVVGEDGSQLRASDWVGLHAKFQRFETGKTYKRWAGADGKIHQPAAHRQRNQTRRSQGTGIQGLLLPCDRSRPCYLWQEGCY